jgi:hypothetical protein
MKWKIAYKYICFFSLSPFFFFLGINVLAVQCEMDGMDLGECPRDDVSHVGW